MELLGVGPTEFLLIIIVVLIVIGPKDLAKTGNTIGKWLNGLVQSDSWRMVQKTSRELRQLPTNLMREANLEKFKTEKDANPTAGSNAGTWQGQIKSMLPPVNKGPNAETEKGNVIQPPVIIPTPAESQPAKKKSSPASHKKTTTTKKTNKNKTTKTTSKTAPRNKKNA